MSEILAEAGHIARLSPEISGKIIFGLQCLCKADWPAADEIRRVG
jgi:hypothetical protein